MAEDSKFSYGEVHTYLNSGEYPPDCDKNYKRSLRRKAANFTVEEGSLGSIILETRRTRIEVDSNNIKLNNCLITDLIRVSQIQRVCNACVGDDILRCRTQFNGESRPTGQYSMATCVPSDVAR